FRCAVISSIAAGASQTFTNVARIGQVAQSSTYGNAKPENAIDGNRASNYNQGSCAHTNNNLNPWWRLDLLKPYKINTVTITNRQDCCPERINGAEIRIGNSLNDNGNMCCNLIHRCWGITNLCMHGMEGRYINIVIPGRTEYLTLCEVEQTSQWCWSHGWPHSLKCRGSRALARGHIPEVLLC
uniref:Fucolectin tachylectin-4 pentraxin-1 domain-containing protein n=1 Tax=Maylandia zebra TaxID=106582 RepID=A0A3P9AWS5_9CICH